MQVRLDTGRRLLSDPGLTPGMLLGPRLNVMAGVRLIQENLQRFGALPDAVAAYNAGVPRKNAAGQYTNSKGDTMVQRYVDRVLSYYQTYLSGAPLGPVGLSTAAALGIGGAVVLGIAIWLLSSGD
jgi:soluble lytic murein transglycosylase-like protein